MSVVGAACLLAAACAPRQPTSADGGAPLVQANDNRSPAGTLRGGVLDLRLEARLAAWRPDAGVDTVVTVLAFAEENKHPMIPGPLLRVPQGTEVWVRVRNSIPDSVRIGLPPPRQQLAPEVRSIADPVLIVHGLRAGTVPIDTLHIAPGGVREVRYRAEEPGTYLYWGATSERAFATRTGRDAQLTGAIVVDPAGVEPDLDERIFVITMLDIYADSSRGPPYDNLFEVAINGLSWPYTERLHYAVGDTVRWRWLNSTFSEHPMHLHGFHFRTLARGDGSTEERFALERVPLGVTELMEPGSTLRLEWVPTTAGNWIFHCHLIDHFTPDVVLELPPNQEPDITAHPLRSMAGLVLGITATDETSGPPEETPRHRLRLLAQQRQDSDGVIRSLVLQEGAEPARDSVRVPGPPLILTRGETTAITLVNRMDEPTTIHWHGMELESVYDGVAGWSRTGGSIAPLVAPRDSFVVYITPPRAGTFIYHTHMGLTEQLQAGMYGPLLVLEPSEVFDPSSDHVFIFGHALQDGDYRPVINGSSAPPPVVFGAGTTHRLRIINIAADLTSEFMLTRNSERLHWEAFANDDADLPRALRTEGPAFVRLSAGETYDFMWTPDSPGKAALQVYIPFPTEPGGLTLRQPIRIR